jgi:hypothetical protein
MNWPNESDEYRQARDELFQAASTTGKLDLPS